MSFHFACSYTIPVCFVGTTEAEVNAVASMKTISKNIQSYLASSPAEKVFLLIDQAPFPGEVNDPRLVTVAKETTSEGFAFYDFAFPFPVEEVKTPTCAVIYVGPHVKVAIDLGCLCYHQTPLLIDSCTGEPFCVNVMRDLAKRSAAVDAAKECSHVGIVVENPNIDLHIKLAQLLQNLCFANGVFANILYVGRINEAKVGNFPDLECFVHIACAGKELFSFAKPVLTPFEFICAKFPVDFWSNQELRDYGQLLSYCHKNLVSESDTPGSSQELDGQQDRQVVIKDFHQLTTTFESVRSRYSFYGLEIDQQNRDMQLHKGTTGNSVAYDHEPVE